MNCLVCDRPMARGRRKPPPGLATHRGRGLCSRDYQREKAAGRLQSWPRMPATRTTHDPATCAVCEDVEWLESTGAHESEWAGRLGTTAASLAKHLYRYGKPELARRVERLYRAERKAVA